MSRRHHYACSCDRCDNQRNLADLAIDTDQILVDLLCDVIYVPDPVIVEARANGHSADTGAVLERGDGRCVYVWRCPDEWRAA
jgi:hypothetical protein